MRRSVACFARTDPLVRAPRPQRAAHALVLRVQARSSETKRPTPARTHALTHAQQFGRHLDGERRGLAPISRHTKTRAAETFSMASSDPPLGVRSRHVPKKSPKIDAGVRDKAVDVVAAPPPDGPAFEPRHHGHACTPPRTHARTHARTHSRTHACTHVLMNECMRARMNACTFVRLQRCTKCTLTTVHY